MPNYRIASGLGSIFIAAGAVMDRIAFPDKWQILVLLRAECSLTLLLIYSLLGTAWGRRYHLVIGHFIEGSLVLSILAMVAMTGYGDSPYYAGLCLIMVGASLLLRWSLRHGLVNMMMCCGGYTVLVWLFSDASTANPRSLATSTFFLYVTGFFTAAGTFFLYQLRLNEFRLREELTAERKRLEESHRQLKALDESKTNFFANMSHELRTPLTLILGPIEQLVSYGPIRENRQMSRLVSAMEENGLRLLRLINELLDLIKLDGGQQELRSELLPVKEVVESVFVALRPTAEQKGVDLICDVSQAPEGLQRIDRMKVEKILVNLATNAVKFTPSGGEVCLGVSQKGDQYVLKVSDTGNGMSEEELPNVFRRFWQADASAKRKHRGAGIGLSLVKSLVELMDGEVDVQSELGKGTTFCVSLPLEQVAVGDVVPEEDDLELEQPDVIEKLYRKAQFDGSPIEDVFDSPTPSAEFYDDIRSDKPLVLVAEDEPALRELISGQLADYRLLVASNGAQAWEMAKQYCPDLIMLDWMMPEKDGLEVCRLIRETTALERTPIVMLTARIDERSKLDALEAGANDFLTKPFVPTELKLRVGQLLKQSKYQKEIVRKSEELGAAMKDLQESESKLVQAEKLSSLGEMSAGIIHEINNPLNYAKTSLYSLKMFTKLLPEEERQDFSEITSDVEDGLARVIQIVKDLRSFAVKDKDQFSDVNLAEIVATSGRLLGNKLSKIQFEPSVPDHIHLYGNGNQLCQVLINFLQNALDAIDMSDRDLEEAFIKIECEEDDDMVSLHIRDNGCGISEENRERIFDPFFSSKDIGSGMGLGLSICYRILQAHHVDIELESEEGKGTHFTLNFPLNLEEKLEIEGSEEEQLEGVNSITNL